VFRCCTESVMILWGSVSDQTVLLRQASRAMLQKIFRPALWVHSLSAEVRKSVTRRVAVQPAGDYALWTEYTKIKTTIARATQRDWGRDRSLRGFRHGVNAGTFALTRVACRSTAVLAHWDGRATGLQLVAIADQI